VDNLLDGTYEKFQVRISHHILEGQGVAFEVQFCFHGKKFRFEAHRKSRLPVTRSSNGHKKCALYIFGVFIIHGIAWSEREGQRKMYIEPLFSSNNSELIKSA
jgi:hypothetical protein